MIRFSKEKVLLLYKLIAEETGGSVGLRDEGLLESALESAFSGFGGQEFYPSKEEKGARIIRRRCLRFLGFAGKMESGKWKVESFLGFAGSFCKLVHPYRRLRRPYFS